MHDHIYSFASYESIVKAYKLLVSLTDYFENDAEPVKSDFLRTMQRAMDGFGFTRINYDTLKAMQELYEPSSLHRFLEVNNAIGPGEDLRSLTLERRIEINNYLENEVLNNFEFDVHSADTTTFNYWIGQEKTASEGLLTQILREHLGEFKAAQKMLPPQIYDLKARSLGIGIGRTLITDIFGAAFISRLAPDATSVEALAEWEKSISQGKTLGDLIQVLQTIKPDVPREQFLASFFQFNDLNSRHRLLFDR